MFSASSLYFLVAIFGGSIESDETHISQPVEGQEEVVVNESGRNESQVALETHNETSETPEQHLQEEQALAQNASESNQIEREQREETHQEMFEKQRRMLELPLSVGAGIGYAAIGIWMILNKRNSKSPYIIAIVGS